MSGARSPGGIVRPRRSDAQRNELILAQAAVTAIHRDGLRVPLGTIAADAGVGIGTLYRHFPTRNDLLDYLTQRSFEQVLGNAREADRLGVTPIDALRRFIEAAIKHRNELVLPLHGGPPITWPATLAVRSEVHRILLAILDRGRADGTLKDHLQPGDVFIFGALLAQPHRPDAAWDAGCRRILENYLDGLKADRR